MEAASQNGIAFAQTLLTQPQPWDEDGADADDASNDAGVYASSGNDCDSQRASGKTADAADGSSVFEVEEDEGNASQDDDCGDGFNLLTQSNELFKGSTLGGGDSSSDGSGEDSSESSGSEDDESGSDSSPEEGNGGETPLQERRARNVRRNENFIKTFKLALNARMNGDQPEKMQEKQLPKQKPDETAGQDECRADSVDDNKEIKKRRGMLFIDTSVNKRQKTSLNVPPLSTKSVVDEFKHNYPHRSKQIHILCSQLVTIVQKSKFAWQITDNVRSSGNTQYSEASYQGNTKLAAPSPILITGNGGSGKTSIVRDALNALQKFTNGEVADAYVDCASSESGSVAAVMNSAYRQLYECYHLSVFGSYANAQVKGKGKAGSGVARSTLGGDDFEEDYESDGKDEDLDAEDLIERSRKKGMSRKKSMAAKPKSYKNNSQKSVPQTRLRSSLESKAASKPTPEKSTGLNGSFHNSNKNTQNSGSVALFGRAISALIQGHTTRKRSPQNWRCAFLILDNADRIISWKKHGSINPLTQLFLLPSVMGINLTIIFISRSTIFQYSSVHNPPATVLDAVHPQKIHFDSYTSVEMIKSILHVPRVQKSIMGRSTMTSHIFSCTMANTLRSKLNDLLYISMIHSFVPSVKSTTQDVTEITRLARLLWLEYVAPLHDLEDPSLKALTMQVLGCLRRDVALSNNDQCHNSNCSFCQCLSLEPNGDAKGVDLDVTRKRLSERLDRGIRDSMRNLLSSTIMMPGRVLNKQNIEPYAKRLPYTTKFLLLAAFLCQSKRPEQDVNLFTTKNTGKSKKTRKSNEGLGSAYASSSKEVKQRQPSFPLERLLSVFYSIIGQYGQHFMIYKEEGATNVAQLGTNRLFKSISQLIAMGLLSSIGNAKFNEKFNHDLLEMTSAKFSCTMSKDDARVISSSVNFPLDKYGCGFL